MRHFSLTVNWFAFVTFFVCRNKPKTKKRKLQNFDMSQLRLFGDLIPEKSNTARRSPLDWTRDNENNSAEESNTARRSPLDWTQVKKGNSAGDILTIQKDGYDPKSIFKMNLKSTKKWTWFPTTTGNRSTVKWTWFPTYLWKPICRVYLLIIKINL